MNFYQLCLYYFTHFNISSTSVSYRFIYRLYTYLYSINICILHFYYLFFNRLPNYYLLSRTNTSGYDRELQTLSSVIYFYLSQPQSNLKKIEFEEIKLNFMFNAIYFSML